MRRDEGLVDFLSEPKLVLNNQVFKGLRYFTLALLLRPGKEINRYVSGV